MEWRTLVGSGDRIALFTLPFLVVGLALNFMAPALFSVGGPPAGLKFVSLVLLVPGVTIWIWSVVLILANVPRGQLITSGPYRLARHPLYTGVALLVLPWLGILLDSWLGILVGMVLYVASRRFSPREEEAMAKTFGPGWDEYRRTVKIPWL